MDTSTAFNVSLLQENLAKGLGIVKGAVAGRSTLAVTTNVLISAMEPDRVKLAATDLEIGIVTWIGAKVAEQGEITIPARLLGEYISSLPPERVTLKTDVGTQTMNIGCAKFESNIKGIDAGDFPVVPVNSQEQGISLDLDAFRQAIEQTIIAACADESRPVLTGVLFELKQDRLTLAAADGFRLSVKKIPVDYSGEPVTAIIPARALAELVKISKDQEQLMIFMEQSRKRVLFKMEDIAFTGQLIEGVFPDYTRIIPQSYKTRAVVDRQVFLKSIKMAELFARDSAHIVKLEIVPSDDPLMNGRVTIVAQSAESGDNVSDVDASIDGDGMTIAFNGKYLIDVLSVMESPHIMIETSEASNPGILRQVGDDTFTHVIMPMAISDGKKK